MAQGELSAVEQNSRLALWLFQLAVWEHHRLAPDAVSQAVWGFLVRLEVILSLDLTQAQLNNESAVQHREPHTSLEYKRRSAEPDIVRQEAQQLCDNYHEEVES